MLVERGSLNIFLWKMSVADPVIKFGIHGLGVRHEFIARTLDLSFHDGVSTEAKHDAQGNRDCPDSAWYVANHRQFPCCIRNSEDVADGIENSDCCKQCWYEVFFFRILHYLLLVKNHYWFSCSLNSIEPIYNISI